MMTKFYSFILSCIIIASTATAQNFSYGNDLFLKLNPEHTEGNIPLLIKGDVAAIQQQVRMAGGIFKYAYGDIAAVEMPLDNMRSLLSEARIERIEYAGGKGHLLNDTMIINTRARSVHQGLTPLTKEYTGKDVVIGYLDTGVEINHPDFWNADSTSRIKYIWDQNVNSGIPPAQFTYGREWTDADINNHSCTHNDPNGYYGHGSNVVGIGSGNGRAVNDFTGVAPESHIVVVALKMNQNFMSNVADGIKYVFAKADSLGLPCVVNTSVGTYTGSHDGRDLIAQLIDNMIKEKPGRVVVAAAGNAGNIPYHLGYQVTSDTNFTWFKYNSGIGLVYFELWADTANFNGVNFSFQADKSAGYVNRGSTRFFNVKQDMNLHIATNGFVTDTIKMNGNRIGTIDIYGERIGDRYRMDMVITPDTTGYWWRFRTTGTGRFDVWSGNATNGTSDMISSNLPNATTLPDIIYYKAPDLTQTMVGSWSCLESVITVANYENRQQYMDYTNSVFVNPQLQGSLADNSSQGPTRDGRIKPDIAAPGNTTLTTGTLAMLNYFRNNQPYKVSQSGWHNRNGGTSMAAPAVAGVAALYLEKFPDADWQQVKAALTQGTYTDTHTGSSLPDSKWGYGKVDAFASLTLVHGCTDTSAPNYDPLATIDDGSCDTTTIGISSPESDRMFLKIYPVPVQETAVIEYRLDQDGEQGALLIYNILGSKINEILVEEKQGSFIFDASQLQSGIYFISLMSGNKMLQSRKIIIQ